MQVDSVLSYLEGDLGLSKEDLSKVVQKFPEVMNLNVERRLKANIEHMQKVSASSISIHSLQVSKTKAHRIPIMHGSSKVLLQLVCMQGYEKQ